MEEIKKAYRKEAVSEQFCEDKAAAAQFRHLLDTNEKWNEIFLSIFFEFSTKEEKKKEK